MKHFFHIHNNSSYICALGIKNYLSLNNDDVVFFIARGIKIHQEKIKVTTIPDRIYYHPYNLLKKLHRFHWIRNREIISEIDAMIESASQGEEFIYYSPHSRNSIYRVYASHPGCAGVNYIEDGMDGYLGREGYYAKFPFEIPVIHKIVNYFLFRNIKIFCYSRLKPFADPLRNIGISTSRIYVLSEKAFEFRENRVLIESKYYVPSFQHDSLKLENYILLLDAVVEQKVAKLEHLSMLLIKIAEKLRSSKVLVKYHPIQSEEVKRSLVEIFSRFEIDLVEYESHVPFEVVLFSYKGLNIYGIGSSLLVYASLMNDHKVYALYDFFQIECDFVSPRLGTWDNALKNKSNVRTYAEFREIEV
ncbi:polysialyltransferase family glycosyltransferase [Marinoscillum sp.]|uniref:polysialyltransferase family glycosyltransferase n=1 Tax=Marinoscillum sp. TaxID=2024838 RepID=UPI003BABE0F1